MTRADVFSLSLKLAAVYVWIQALSLLAQIGYFVRQLYEPGQAAFFVLAPLFVPAILLGALGVLLYYLSSFLADRLEGGEAPATTSDGAGIGALGLRIAAILIVERAIARVGFALAQIRVARIDGHWSALLLDLLSVAILAAIGARLFLRADEIAPRFFGEDPPRPADARYGVLQAVAFSVAGIWILADVLPDAVRLLQGAGSGWTKIVETLLRVAFGVAIFVGGGRLAAFWARVRTTVVEPKSRPL